MNQKFKILTIVLLVFTILLSYFQDRTSNDTITKARIALSDDDVLAALVYLNNAVKQDSASAAFLLRAEIFYSQGKLQEALDDIDQSVKLSPSSERAIFLKAKVITTLGDTVNAINLLDSLINISQNKNLKTEMRIEKGRLLLYIKQFETALITLKTITNYQSNAFALYYMGVILRYQAEALTEMNQDRCLMNAMYNLNKSVEVDHNFADAWFQKAMIHLHFKELEQYHLAMERALILDSLNYYYYFVRANNYKSQAACDEALLDYNKAIKYNAGAAFLYEERASLYFNCFMDSVAGLKDIQKAEAIDKRVLNQASRK